MIKQHLLIIIDNSDKIEPKKYAITMDKMGKSKFMSWTKEIYENKYKNTNYETYYFEHIV